MSAHDTVWLQTSSTWDLMVSITSKPLMELTLGDAVFSHLDGPSWTVQLGRRNSTTANFSLANSDIPGPTCDLSAPISSFSKKNLSTSDMVAISVGHARCKTLRTRIYNETNIDSSFATSLQSNCPASGGDNNLAPLDVSTSFIFDNFYYRNLVNKKGLFHSDQQHFNGGSVDSQVSSYNTNSAKFFSDFAGAMVNMENISPTGATQFKWNFTNTNL